MDVTPAMRIGNQRLDWPGDELLRENERFLTRQLRQQIFDFEAQHGMTSEYMAGEVRAGRLQETADICTWLLKLKLLDTLENE